MIQNINSSFWWGAALCAVFFIQRTEAAPESQRYWPQWRGPLASGVGPEADPPLEWGEDKNIKWKTLIPGAGSSTPVVWGDRVFVLSALRVAKPSDGSPGPNAVKDTQQPTARETGPASEGGPRPEPGGPARPGGPGGGQRGGFGRAEKPTEAYQFLVLGLEKETGRVVWQKVARQEVPHEGVQANNTYASASPLTDGQVVLAFFGSRGLHCYDLDGNLKWSKDFGHMRTRMGFGEGGSPALYGDTIVVCWDDENDNDFIVALDKSDGKELWRTPRHEDTGWSTPVIIEHAGRRQVVVNATGKVRSYDLQTGKEIWSCAGQTPNAIPSPVANADTVFCTSGFRGTACYAIKLSSNGDISGTDAVRWTHNKSTPYVPSPLLTQDFIYFVSGNNGILTCLNATNGDVNFEQERLEGIREVYASPVAAKERVYILGRDGKCVVLKKGPKLEILATNQIDDKTDASLALAGKDLFIRGKQHLYCITEK